MLQYDLKNRRTFLKRCVYNTISLDDIFIGATINIYSRHLNVVDYGDKATKSKLATAKSR